MQLHAATYSFAARREGRDHHVAILRQENTSTGLLDPEVIATAKIAPDARQVIFVKPTADIDPAAFRPIEDLLTEQSSTVFRGADSPELVIIDTAYSWLSLNELPAYEKPNLQSEDGMLVLYADSMTRSATRSGSSRTSSAGDSRPRRRKQTVKVWI